MPPRPCILPADAARWRCKRGRTGERSDGRLLEGCDGGLIVGQVVERLLNLARRVETHPAHQQVEPAVAHLGLEQVLSASARRRCFSAPSARCDQAGEAHGQVAAKAVGTAELGRRCSTLSSGKAGGVEGMEVCWASCARGPGMRPFSEWKAASGEDGRLLHVELHLAARRELNVPPGGVELRVGPAAPARHPPVIPPSDAKPPRRTPRARGQRRGAPAKSRDRSGRRAARGSQG